MLNRISILRRSMKPLIVMKIFLFLVFFILITFLFYNFTPLNQLKKIQLSSYLISYGSSQSQR